MTRLQLFVRWVFRLGSFIPSFSIRLRWRGTLLAIFGIQFMGYGLSKEPVDFYEDVFPFLEARCFKCHSDEKQKGDLRLDSPAWIVRGSENGEVFTPGDANDSPLYYLTTFDEDDPDYMPSKGKGLTGPEKELLRRWIDEGADFGDGMGDMMAMSSMVPPGADVKSKYTDELPLPPASYELSQSLAEAVVALKMKGVLVDTVNHDAQFLEISYTYVVDRDAYSLSLLDPIVAAVVKLNYGRSAVSDGQLEGIGRFESLSYLDLRNTAISDASLEEIRDLASLEYLNLYGTAVTDSGLRSLYKMKNLQQIYLHNTSVTTAGVRALQKALPNLRVVR